MPNQYATIVFPNGLNIKFRLRDGDNNRFKVLSSDSIVDDCVKTFHGIDADDCDGNQLATIIRLYMNHLPT